MGGVCSCASSLWAFHPGLVDGADSLGLVYHIDPIAGQHSRQVRVNRKVLLLNIHVALSGRLHINYTKVELRL